MEYQKRTVASCASAVFRQHTIKEIARYRDLQCQLPPAITGLISQVHAISLWSPFRKRSATPRIWGAAPPQLNDPFIHHQMHKGMHERKEGKPHVTYEAGNMKDRLPYSLCGVGKLSAGYSVRTKWCNVNGLPL